jgi:hypothetical protein
MTVLRLDPGRLSLEDLQRVHAGGVRLAIDETARRHGIRLPMDE